MVELKCISIQKIPIGMMLKLLLKSDYVEWNCITLLDNSFLYYVINIILIFNNGYSTKITYQLEL